VLRVLFLLSRRFLERDDSDQDARDEEEKRDDEPNDTPNLGRETATDLREGRCIRGIYFPGDSIIDYVPKDIETRHDADEQHEESQYFASFKEPKKHDQTRHAQQENPRQEIPPGPPERKDKKDGKGETGDFARIGVEPASDKRCTDEARTEVSSREGEPGYTARHARRAALVRIKLDGVNVCAREDAYERVAHLMKPDREQLERINYKVQIRHMPQDTNDEDITTSDDECRALCRIRCDAGGNAASG